ncbi:MAG: DUF951 domain-containing protein [Clostridia bacterium]
MPMKLNVGDIIELKKQHPCGSKQWEVLRAGMDFRIRCMGCDHQVMLARLKLEKNIRKIIQSNEAGLEGDGRNNKM